MTHSTERGRPPAHEEPSPGINRRQSVASINDSSAGDPEMPGREDPYTDLPHPADTLDEPERPHRIPLRKRLLRLSDLATLPAVEPLVDGIIYRDTLAQLAGAPGSYKSFATVGLSVAVAAGENWEGHRVPRAGKVVYVQQKAQQVSAHESSPTANSAASTRDPRRPPIHPSCLFNWVSLSTWPKRSNSCKRSARTYSSSTPRTLHSRPRRELRH